MVDWMTSTGERPLLQGVGQSATLRYFVEGILLLLAGKNNEFQVKEVRLKDDKELSI